MIRRKSILVNFRQANLPKRKKQENSANVPGHMAFVPGNTKNANNSFSKKNKRYLV